MPSAVDQALAEQPDLGEAHFALSFYPVPGLSRVWARPAGTRFGAQSNAAQLRRGGNQRRGCATSGQVGADAGGTEPGAGVRIRATRARRSSLARPTRNYAVTPRPIRPMHVPRSCPPILRCRRSVARRIRSSGKAISVRCALHSKLSRRRATRIERAAQYLSTWRGGRGTLRLQCVCLAEESDQPTWTFSRGNSVMLAPVAPGLGLRGDGR